MAYTPLTCILSEGLNLTGCTKDNTGGVEQVIFANFKDVVPAGSPTGFTYDSTTSWFTNWFYIRQYNWSSYKHSYWCNCI